MDTIYFWCYLTIKAKLSASTGLQELIRFTKGQLLATLDTVYATEIKLPKNLYHLSDI